MKHFLSNIVDQDALEQQAQTHPGVLALLRYPKRHLECQFLIIHRMQYAVITAQANSAP